MCRLTYSILAIRRVPLLEVSISKSRLLIPEMIGQPLRRDPPRTKSPLLGAELVWWYRFTALAEACGYAEVDNTYRRGEEADYQMAQTFLQQVRPPQLYGTSMGSSVQQMVDLLGKDFPSTEGADAPPVVDTYGLKCGPDITSRDDALGRKCFRSMKAGSFSSSILSALSNTSNHRSLRP